MATAAFLSPDNIAVAPLNRRSSDVSRLTFPLQTVIQIVSTAITVLGVSWWTSAEMRSDIRDIRTSMEYERQIKEKDAQIVNYRFQVLESLIKEQGAKSAALSAYDANAKQFQAEMLKRR